MTLKDALLQKEGQDLKIFLQQRFAKNMEFFAHKNKAIFANLAASKVREYELSIGDFGININAQNAGIYPILNGKTTFVQTQIELSQNILNNSRYEVLHNGVFLNFMDEKKLPLTAGANNELIRFVKNLGAQKDYKIPNSFIPNLVIFGIFGGAFLQFLVDSGVVFNSLWIFESNFDLFRICLYFVDFEMLFKSVKNLFLLENQTFFTKNKITSNFLLATLQMYKTPSLNNLKAKFLNDFSSNKRGWGSFEDEMIGVVNSLQNASSLQFAPKKLPLFPLDPVICVIGNGASLDFCLSFIKQYQNKMMILSCGTALRVLQKNGIKVDFQVEIERVDYLSGILGLENLQGPELLCGNMVHPNVLKLSQKSCVFLRGGSSGSYFFKGRQIPLASPFVGNAGASLALMLSRNVIFVGLDCGYILGFKKHASGSFYENESAKIPLDAQKVPSNNANYEVFADSIFMLSAKNLEALILAHTEINKNISVKNIGSGAFIKGAKPTSISQISKDIAQTQDLNKPQLIEIFNKSKLPPKLCALTNTDAKDYIKSIFSFMQFCGDFDEVDFEVFSTQNLKESQSPLKNQHPKNVFLSPRTVLEKHELFKIVDEISNQILCKSQQNPSIGLLFEGSFMHLLQSLLLCSLHLNEKNILGFYKNACEILEVYFLKMALEFSFVAQNSKS